MENNNYSILKKILGVILIILGILGLFLPFLQGFVFIATGLVLLGNKKLLNWLKIIWSKIQLWLQEKFKH
ncbi:MAG: hypothetical protein ABIF12_01105 [bacterium]